MGIARQGATLRDYARPDGSRGSMQHEFKVYGREGEPCDRCGTPIAKTRAGGADVVLPAVSAGDAERQRLGRAGELVEPTVAVEPPELGVATDRLPVDQDLRDGPAARQVEQLLPEPDLVVEGDLLVLEPARVEERLRARRTRTSAL